MLNFLLYLYLPPWLRGRAMFKLMVFRFLEDAFESQKTESQHFYSYPSPRFLHKPPPSPSRQRETISAHIKGTKPKFGFIFYFRKAIIPSLVICPNLGTICVWFSNPDSSREWNINKNLFCCKFFFKRFE